LVRADGRDTQVVRFEREVVAFFVDAADVLGVPKSVAAIYGMCFASADALSFADIADRLDISQGSISQGLRVLREIGALRISEAYVPGPFASDPLSLVHRSRPRERYVPDLELRKLATHFIEQRLEKQLKAGKQRLKAIKRLVPTSDIGRQGTDAGQQTNSSADMATSHFVSAGDALKCRLKHLQSWHDKSRALVPIMKTFLKLS
jgi:hypothetical protein